MAAPIVSPRRDTLAPQRSSSSSPKWHQDKPRGAGRGRAGVRLGRPPLDLDVQTATSSRTWRRLFNCVSLPYAAKPTAPTEARPAYEYAMRADGRGSSVEARPCIGTNASPIGRCR